MSPRAPLQEPQPRGRSKTNLPKKQTAARIRWGTRMCASGHGCIWTGNLPTLSQVTRKRCAFTRGPLWALWLPGTGIQGSRLFPLPGLCRPRRTFQGPGPEGLADQSCDASAQKGPWHTSQSQSHMAPKLQGRLGRQGAHGYSPSGSSFPPGCGRLSGGRGHKVASSDRADECRALGRRAPG